MSRRIPVVALVGRTNVGKSTLFNALVGHRVSVVEDTPGVTRDRNYALVKRGDIPFTLIDTGGLFGAEEAEGPDGYLLRDSVRNQTELAIEESDLVVVVFDGIHGPAPQDAEVVDLIRRKQKPALWVVNKCEKPSNEAGAAEFYEMGITEIETVSAAHKLRIRDLLKKIQATLLELIPDVMNTAEEEQGMEDVEEYEVGDEEMLETEEATEPEIKLPQRPIKIAILGKPNTGKSTLINKIIGKDRLVTSNIAGTTRDNIDIAFSHAGQEYILVDTAGLRKKARVKSVSAERYSNLRSLRALAGCDVAVLLLDASEGVPSEQDLKIAGIIHERGRGLIIALNKWDAVEKDHRTAKEFKDAVQRSFRFTPYAPIVFVSALSGRRCQSILETAKDVHEAAHYRVKTSELNKLLAEAWRRKAPRVVRGEPVKLFFATQVDVAPPTFVLFMNYPKKLEPQFERYLKNALRKEYPFPGVDLKFTYRKRTEKAERARIDARA